MPEFKVGDLVIVKKSPHEPFQLGAMMVVTKPLHPDRLHPHLPHVLSVRNIYGEDFIGEPDSFELVRPLALLELCAPAAWHSCIWKPKALRDK